MNGNVVQNCLQFGCGALNIDGCRIAGIDPRNAVRLGRQYTENADRAVFGKVKAAFVGGSLAGRFPANVLLMPTPEVLAEFPDTGKSTGTKNGSWRTGHQYSGGYSGAPEGELGDEVGYGDSGTAARFFKQVQGGVPDGKA